MSYPYDRATEDPGGMQCEECDVIFIGADYHRICAVCAGINDPPEIIVRVVSHQNNDLSAILKEALTKNEK